MGYNPGISYHGDEYIAKTGIAIAGAVKDWQAKQEEQRKEAEQLQYQDTKNAQIIQYMKSNKQLSPEQYSEYMQAPLKKRSAMLEGWTANHVAQVSAQQDEMKAAAANRTYNIPGTNQPYVQTDPLGRQMNVPQPPKPAPPRYVSPRVGQTAEIDGKSVGIYNEQGNIVPAAPRQVSERAGKPVFDENQKQVGIWDEKGGIFKANQDRGQFEAKGAPVMGPDGKPLLNPDGTPVVAVTTSYNSAQLMKPGDKVAAGTDERKRFDDVVGRTYDIKTKDLSQIDFRPPQKTNEKDEVTQEGSTSKGVVYQNSSGTQISTEDAEKLGYAATAIVPTTDGKTRGVPYPEWKTIVEKYHQLPRMSDTKGGVSVQGGKPNAAPVQAGQFAPTKGMKITQNGAVYEYDGTGWNPVK